MSKRTEITLSDPVSKRIALIDRRHVHLTVGHIESFKRIDAAALIFAQVIQDESDLHRGDVGRTIATVDGILHVKEMAQQALMLPQVYEKQTPKDCTCETPECTLPVGETHVPCDRNN
jgi:hypothetical protein